MKNQRKFESWANSVWASDSEERIWLIDFSNEIIKWQFRIQFVIQTDQWNSKPFTNNMVHVIWFTIKAKIFSKKLTRISSGCK